MEGQSIKRLEQMKHIANSFWSGAKVGSVGGKRRSQRLTGVLFISYGLENGSKENV